MRGYSIVDRHDFGMFGNYAFAAGDIDGDGKAEFAMLSKQGDALLVLDHDGAKAWDATLENRNTWGTAPLLIADVDGDGKGEILAPDDHGARRGVRVFDGRGRELATLSCPQGEPDYDGAVIDAIAAALRADGKVIVVVLLNGGLLYAFEDLAAEATWCLRTSTRYFEHYLHIGDINGDGSDEIVFSGKPGQGHDVNPPEQSFMHVVGLDGRERWRKPLSEIAPGKPVDHLDFIEVAPVLPDLAPARQIVVSMGGCVLDPDGKMLWSLNEAVGHCDWVDVGCTGDGALVLFSTHYPELSVLLADAGGKELWRWEPGDLAGENCVAGHARFIDWDGDGRLEIVFGEQSAPWDPAVEWSGHEPLSTVTQTVNLYVVSLEGKLIERVSYEDQTLGGWWYNGENRPLVLDVDGDGGEEWVWQSRLGAALVIKKTGEA